MSEAATVLLDISKPTASPAAASEASAPKRISFWIVLLAPFLVAAIYIARFGVNVPYLDEWSMPYVFRMVREGTHGFGDLFWPPNNEHRIVIPKMIWTGLGFLS